jgi:hypothetical protein
MYDDPIHFTDPLGDEASGASGDPNAKSSTWGNFLTLLNGIQKAVTHVDILNVKSDWKAQKTLPQQLGKDFMANPLAFLTPAEEVNIAARTLGIELNAAPKLISLDNNALIAAIEGGEKAKVLKAIGTDKPIVSMTVAKEFLVKGNKASLKEFMVETGATISKNGASAAQIAKLQQTAKGLGRAASKGDASFMVSAMNNGASVLTRDKQVSGLMQALGWPNKTF